MSSLTSLGINKNKKKFGPTINKNKNRVRKSADSSQATSSQAASSKGASSQDLSSQSTISPSKTVQSTQSTQTIKPKKPTQSTESKEPTEPTQPKKSIQPSQSMQQSISSPQFNSQSTIRSPSPLMKSETQPSMFARHVKQSESPDKIEGLSLEEQELNESLMTKKFLQQPKVIPAPDVNEQKPVNDSKQNTVAHLAKKTTKLASPSEYPNTPGSSVFSPEYINTPTAMVSALSPEYSTPIPMTTSPEYTETSTLDAITEERYCSVSPIAENENNDIDIMGSSSAREESPVNIMNDDDYPSIPMLRESPTRETTPVPEKASRNKKKTAKRTRQTTETDEPKPTTKRTKQTTETDKPMATAKRTKQTAETDEPGATTKRTKDTDETFEPKSSTKKSKKSKDKAKETTTEPSNKSAPKLKKAVAIGIGIGVPSSSSAATPEGSVAKQVDDALSEHQKKKAEAEKKRRQADFRLPENMRTLDDITGDPSKPDLLDKPMSFFTKDIDGVVSKAYKEMVTKQYEASAKLLEAKSLSGVELEDFERKQKEEEEKKKKAEEERKAEEEKKKRDKANSVLQETSTAPQVRMVNGQIVLDTDSLTVERNQTEQEFYDGAMEVVEENAMTKKVNSHTYSKRKQSSRWKEAETELFYTLLSQFGTDFETISQMIPNRTRSQVRLKFNREEKLCPEKVTEYLVYKRKKADLNFFKEMAGVELEPVPEDFNEMQLV